MGYGSEIGLSWQHRSYNEETIEVPSGKWRSIKSPTEAVKIHEGFSPQAVRDGVVHWNGYSRNNAGGSIRHLVVKFDLCDEEFGEFALPEALVSLPSTSFLVSTLSGSLSVVFYNAFMRNLATDHMSCCTIWVMRDYGNVDSWEQIYKINLDGGLGMMSGIRRCGDILLSTDSGEVVSFNCEDGMVSSTGICGAKSSFFVNEYAESLVLLGKEEEVHGINPQDNRRRRKCIFARILARFLGV